MERLSGAMRDVQEFISGPNTGGQSSIGDEPITKDHNSESDREEEEEDEDAEEVVDGEEEEPEENVRIRELTYMIDSITRSIQNTRENVSKMKTTAENSDKLLNLWQSILFFNKEQDLRNDGGVADSNLDLDPEDLEQIRGLEKDEEVVKVFQEKKNLMSEYDHKSSEYERLMKIYNSLK